MNVVYDSTIVGQVQNAISNAVAAGIFISHIELSEAEMRAFVFSNYFHRTVNADKHYGENVMPTITAIAPVDQEGDVPKSCVFMGVKIVKI